MSIAYPKPHPPFPAPPHTAVAKLESAPAKRHQLHFHKGLAHDGDALVDPAGFKSLRDALSHHTPELFAKIQMAGPKTRRLVNPQCGLGADRQTAAGFYFRLPPPPEQDGCDDTTAAELIELYWMALLRHVKFEDFTGAGAPSEIAAACTELSGLKLYAKADNPNLPKYESRTVNPGSLFRGGDWWLPSSAPHQHVGPYISQFLYLDVPFGSLKFDQRERRANDKDQDPERSFPAYMTKWDEWLAVQNGAPHGKPTVPVPEAASRYIQNMADLARYVHIDKLYQAYLNATFILLGYGASKGKGSPYGMVPCGYGKGDAPQPTTDPWAKNFPAEEGFGSFGDPHILAMVCEVSTRALKAVWYQKWVAHLRLRPEAYAGLVHRALAGVHDPAGAKAILGSAESILSGSNAAARIVAGSDATYLLPMCFPEGSPTHPAYGAGHACVAGACVTVLKAFFDETAKLSSLTDLDGNSFVPKVPNAAGNGLVDYTGPGAADLTVGGELDKVASNIAIGRNMAGVHWRTDYTQSVLLGQRVAISMLYHQRRDFHERPWCYHFTSFAGNGIKIDQYGVHMKKAGSTGGYDIHILDGDDDLDPAWEAHQLKKIW